MELLQRIKKMLVTHSYREAAKKLEISHEQLRKISCFKNCNSLKVSTYNKIAKNLEKHGF